MPAARHLTGTFTIKMGYSHPDFTMGGAGASHYSLNKYKPLINIQLYSGLDNKRLSSSGIKADYRRWQVVFPKPTANVPAALVQPPTVR